METAEGRVMVDKMNMRKDANIRKVHAMYKGKIPPNISYTESDQSPVYGEDAFRLSFDLGTRLDNNTPLYSHLSDWYKTIFRGD